MEENNNRKENIYVFEKSVDIDVERLKSINKSIENERGKSGIIIGFIVLTFISNLEYLKSINCLYLQVLVGVLFIVACFFAFWNFISVKIKDFPDTQGNFKRDWNNKEKFLLFYHEALISSIQEKKEKLTKSKDYNKFSIIAIFFIIIFLSITLFI